MAAADVIDSYVAALPGDVRRVAHAEWGLTVHGEQAGGWPLDVGLRLAEGLLRATAFALPANEALDPWLLLHWNRQTRFVRFACTREGDIWVHADIVATGIDEQALDRLLGLMVQGAVAVRDYGRALATRHTG